MLTITLYRPGGGGWGTPTEESISQVHNGHTVRPVPFEPRGSVHNWTMTAEAAS